MSEWNPADVDAIVGSIEGFFETEIGMDNGLSVRLSLSDCEAVFHFKV